MGNGIRRRPDGTRAWCIVSPRERCRQDVRNGLMIEARIDIGVLNATRRRIRIRTNQFDSGRGIRNTSGALVTAWCTSHVFRREDAHVVIACSGR